LSTELLRERSYGQGAECELPTSVARSISLLSHVLKSGILDVDVDVDMGIRNPKTILDSTHPKEEDRRAQLSQLQAHSKLARQRFGGSRRDGRDVGDEDGDHGDVGEDESFVGWGPSFRVGFIMMISRRSFEVRVRVGFRRSSQI
jgi:hypothetical protein